MSTVARQRARAGASGRALLGMGDAELLHLPVQYRTSHSETRRSPMRPAQNPAGLMQHAEDVLPLGVGQREAGGRARQLLLMAEQVRQHPQLSTTRIILLSSGDRHGESLDRAMARCQRERRKGRRRS